MYAGAGEERGGRKETKQWLGLQLGWVIGCGCLCLCLCVWVSTISISGCVHASRRWEKAGAEWTVAPLRSSTHRARRKV